MRLDNKFSTVQNSSTFKSNEAGRISFGSQKKEREEKENRWESSFGKTSERSSFWSKAENKVPYFPKELSFSEDVFCKEYGKSIEHEFEK